MQRRAFLAGLIWPVSARANALMHGDIAIGTAWALPTSHLGDGQAFVPLTNRGKQPDQLVAARTPVCALVQLRRNNRYDDPPLTAMPLGPGEFLNMQPTDFHLRLMGLQQILKVRQLFPLILDFLNAGEVEIAVRVSERPES